MNTRELQNRIDAIRATGKTTRAMEMIASSKLEGSMRRSVVSTQYLETMHDAVSRLFAAKPFSHPFLSGHAGGEDALIVISADKGLCGDYNHAILSHADRFLAQHPSVDRILAVGYTAVEHFGQSGYKMNNYYAHLQEPHAYDAIMLADDLLKQYLEHQYHTVYLAFTKMLRPGIYETTVEKLLPIAVSPAPEPSALSMEPCGGEELTRLLSQTVMAQIYSALADSDYAMQYDRMLAMRKSTENGEEMVRRLTLQYHRMRKERITAELQTLAHGEQKSR